MVKRSVFFILSLTFFLGGIAYAGQTKQTESSCSEQLDALEVKVFRTKIEPWQSVFWADYDLKVEIAEWSKLHPKIKILKRNVQWVSMDGQDFTHFDIGDPRTRKIATILTFTVFYIE